MKLAIVGRPNAGKSTLINRMIGEDRLITGPEAGITRDSIRVDWQWEKDGEVHEIQLFDTAGMRKRAKVVDKLEKLSVMDALHAVDFAERSEEHTSELQSLMRISYAVLCMKKKHN